MTAVASERELVGRLAPTIELVPEFVSSAGQEAVELAAAAGLFLDPWQQYVLDRALGERADGKWAAFECGLIVSRQNGKGAIFEARELAGLFLFDEELILHSAHEFKTALEHFRRVRALIDGKRDFSRRVKRISNNTNLVEIELTTGQRLRFVARSTGSGRGFSGDCNILDEAFNLPDAAIDALMPTMSARKNPQLWYGSSAPDHTLAPCDHLGRVRKRAIDRSATDLFYAEWSAELCSDMCGSDCREHDQADDPDVWAKANPGLGIRISLETVARERASMSEKGFARERLSVGNYPSDAANQWRVIPQHVWEALADEQSEIAGRVVLAVDVTPERSWSAIAVAGLRTDQLEHLEVIDHRPGTGWLIDRLVDLRDRWNPVAIVVDPGSPAGSLVADLEKAGITVTKPTARDVAHACGALFSACGVAEGDEATMRYFPHPALSSALAGAETKPLADAWKWNRNSPSVDLCPLVAVTLARWGYQTHLEEADPVEPFAFYA